MLPPDLLIGIYVPPQANSTHLWHTLEALQLSVETLNIRVHVLFDGHAGWEVSLPFAGEVFVLDQEQAKGKPFAFNQLTRFSSPEAYLFLEPGTLPGPGCLERLSNAIHTNRSCGIAGPSSNFCWNEQRIHQDAEAFLYRETATSLAQQYGDETAELTPLHSLSDFCYMVHRHVVESIGQADETFGDAPCWEMDYNIRAHRAGFTGLWVKGAFAQRTFIAPSEDIERARLLYQNKFCALREKNTTEQPKEHCTGDACSNFAQEHRIEMHIPFDERIALSASAFSTFQPLVSCIMPTSNRPEFIRQAIYFFESQDYPNKELLIVYNSPDDLPNGNLTTAGIRLLQTNELSIGGKRNYAVQYAKGTIIAQWDDDDLYHPKRLTEQVQPILEGTADITGLTNTGFFELSEWQYWTCSPALFARIFHENVTGGTLVYLRSIWERLAHYRTTSLQEDAIFLNNAIKGGARLARVEGEHLFTYLRHRGNTWKFTPGVYVNPASWSLNDIPKLIESNKGFYQSLKAKTPPPVVKVLPDKPKVSCIMPTADRHNLLPMAIGYFLRQSYDNKELIVLDDGKKDARSLVPNHPQIRYKYVEGKASIGAKRNRCCELATGEIIVHLDDDDWYGPDWIAKQVTCLKAGNFDICGLDQLFFYDPAKQHAWKYIYPKQKRDWVGGATMAYHKAFWKKHTFPDINVGEDNHFVWQHPGRIGKHHHIEEFVSILHDNNTSPKRTSDPRWNPCPVNTICNILGPDLIRYKRHIAKYSKTRH